ncbi:MAG: SGNH/GDSL hydrolase family protein [Rhodocyclaceae bacterium]|nr:SGNH/GDSL hydrolase family protein [Rhodocyclaceae bacterium]
MIHRFALAALLSLILTFATAARATQYSSLYVFGDSLSDAGDNPAAVLSIFGLTGGALQPPPYFGGRFSNGPVAAEVLASTLGLNDPLHFFDFAVGGATTGLGNTGDGGTTTSFGSVNLPGIGAQVGGFLAGVPALDPAALYMLWGGPNDFLNTNPDVAAILTVCGGNALCIIAAANAVVIPGAVADLTAALIALHAAGAQHFLVPNMVDLGLTPRAASLGATGLFSLVSTAFNNALAAALLGLPFASDIVQFDTAAALNAVLADPAAHGFTNTTDPCLNPGPCADPDSHVFWDDLHPTAHIHAILGGQLAAAVPLPSSALLFALAWMLLRSRAYARRPDLRAA